MKVEEFYSIDLILNGEAADFAPASYSFDIEDSIHMMYPLFTVYFPDTTGLFQEYFASVEGLIYELSYGRTDDTVTSRYVVMGDALPETLSAGILNGTIKIELVHEFYDFQQIRSKAYKDRVSGIVRTIADSYNFSSKTINDTGNQDTWYQPLMTDTEFIERVLLPHSYSTNAFDSPFFCFIGVDNSFNFRNYKAMLDGSPVEELTFTTQTEESTQDPNVIRSIQRIRVGSQITKSLRRREIYSLNEESGELITEEDSLGSYPSSITKVPIVENNEFVTGYYFHGFTEPTPKNDQNLAGDRASSMKDGLFLDRFIVELPLNVNLRAGKTINLNIQTYKDEQGGQPSLSFRGKYLIENSRHRWIGTTQNGATRLLVSRKNVTAPTTYFASKRFLES